MKNRIILVLGGVVLFLLFLNIEILTAESIQGQNKEKLQSITIEKTWNLWTGTKYSYFYNNYRIRNLNTIENLMEKANDYAALDMMSRSKILRISGTVVNFIGSFDLGVAIANSFINGDIDYTNLVIGGLTVTMGNLLSMFGQNIRNESIEHYNGTIKENGDLKIGLSLHRNQLVGMGVNLGIVF